MSVTLRRAGPEDAATLVDIGRRSFTETFGHLYTPENLAAFLEGHNEAQWAAEIADPAYAVLLAEEGGVAAGYAKLAPPKLPVPVREGSVELRQFYILAPWHGSGLARRMMGAVIEEARVRGAPEITLSVFVDNHRAQAFYKRYGFEDIGRYAFMVGSHEDEDRIWRLTLDG